jgi:hypothetical protein
MITPWFVDDADRKVLKLTKASLKLLILSPPFQVTLASGDQHDD